jgi:hypothetical protein
MAHRKKTPDPSWRCGGLKFRSPHFSACQIDEPYCVRTGRVGRFAYAVHHFTDFYSRLSEIGRIEHAAVENYRVGVRNSRVEELITPEHQWNNGTRPRSEQFMFFRNWHRLMPEETRGLSAGDPTFSSTRRRRAKTGSPSIFYLDLIVCG